MLNGNGRDGGASVAAASLAQAGFRVASTGDASTYDFTQTIVRHAPGQQAKAALLRSSLVAGAAVQEDRSLAGTSTDVALVLGSDYAGLKAAAPATTAPGAGASTAPGPAAQDPATTTKVTTPPC